jgi:hypothetical protein
MVRTVFSRAWRVGRATALALGVAVMLALVVGVASAALAGTGVGAVFNLGETNTVNALSRLVGNVAGPLLVVDNNSAVAGARALDLRVEPNRAPLTVNPTAGKATNFNVDKLDGKDSTSFLSSSVYTKQSSSEGVANGIKEADLDCDAGDVMLSGGYFFGSGAEVLSDTVFNNRYFLAWRSGDQPVNAVLRVTCANQ